MVSRNISATFHCSDSTINDIWEECMNAIRLFADKESVTAQVNVVADRTFCWFLSIYDSYMYTGDKMFVQKVYPRMRSFISFCLSRTDAQGMIQVHKGDQVFVDWSPKASERKGVLSFEQILYCKCLETMALCAHLLEKKADEERYFRLFTQLRRQLLPTFWDEKRHALVHSVVDGKRSRRITRHSNLFAIFFDYLTESQKQEVAKSVIYSQSVKPFTTPFMQFYELVAMSLLGNLTSVLERIKELYNSSIHSQSMSSYPYGMSLSHTWFVSPVYLLTRYILGVNPVKPGYEEFEIRPVLGGLEFVEGRIPVPQGEISVYMDTNEIRVLATASCGYLYFSTSRPPKTNVGEIEKYVGKDHYRLWIQAGEEVVVTFRSTETDI